MTHPKRIPLDEPRNRPLLDDSQFEIDPDGQVLHLVRGGVEAQDRRLLGHVHYLPLDTGDISRRAVAWWRQEFRGKK